MSKLEKELAVFGHSGTSLWENALVVSTMPLLISLCNEHSSISREILQIAIPTLFAHTGLLGGSGGLSGLCLVLLLLHVFFPPKHITTVVIEAKQNPKLALLRATTVMSTVICILAVDFPAVFPRDYCKTEWFGTGLMDLGVGAYVFTGAMSSSKKNSMKTIMVLLVLGIARLLITHMLDYQSHLGEYGKHWNFFFTLACTKLINALLLLLFLKAERYSLECGVCLLVVHQFLLSNTALGEWVNANNHLDNVSSNIVWQNKEGLVSLFGYVSLDWIARGMKSSKFGLFELTTRQLFALELFLVALLQLALPEVSRRSCNAGFVVWVISIAVLILFWQSALGISSTQHRLVKAMSSNQLVVFLVANLATGAVNFSIDTLHATQVQAMLVLTAYVTFIVWFANNLCV